MKLGFVGIGKMGLPMAGHLLAAGQFDKFSVGPNSQHVKSNFGLG